MKTAIIKLIRSNWK